METDLEFAAGYRPSPVRALALSPVSPLLIATKGRKVALGRG